jgi:membrane protease YdiL (CAAX protease family)
MAAVVVLIGGIGGEAVSPGDLSRMRGAPDLGWFGVAAIVLVVNGFGEEVGWRGFAWPQLRQSRSLTSAAALMAVPWALWHVPLFWIDSGFRDMSLLAFPGFALSLFAGAVVLGWLFDRSGSVVVVALWHSMLNMSTGTEGTSGAAVVVSVLVVGIALVVVQVERRATLPPSRDVPTR